MGGTSTPAEDTKRSDASTGGPSATLKAAIITALAAGPPVAIVDRTCDAIRKAIGADTHIRGAVPYFHEMRGQRGTAYCRNRHAPPDNHRTASSAMVGGTVCDPSNSCTTTG